MKRVLIYGGCGLSILLCMGMAFIGGWMLAPKGERLGQAVSTMVAESETVIPHVIPRETPSEKPEPTPTPEISENQEQPQVTPSPTPKISQYRPGRPEWTLPEEQPEITGEVRQIEDEVITVAELPVGFGPHRVPRMGGMPFTGEMVEVVVTEETKIYGTVTVEQGGMILIEPGLAELADIQPGYIIAVWGSREGDLVRAKLIHVAGVIMRQEIPPEGETI